MLNFTPSNSFLKIATGVSLVASIIIIPAKAEEREITSSGFYVGGFLGFNEVDAVGNKPNAEPWNVKTGRDRGDNLGIFVGFNYNLKDVTLGLEFAYQDHVADVPASTVASNFAGSLEHGPLEELKFHIGKRIEKMLPYTFVSKGEMLQTWASYSNTDPYEKGFTGYGLGLDYFLTNHIFTGIEYGALDWEYKTSTTTRVYTGDVDYFRLRLGYHF